MSERTVYGQRAPLPRVRVAAAIVAILLMVPVLLDGAGVIALGEARLLPFLLLPLAAVMVAADVANRRREDAAHG